MEAEEESHTLDSVKGRVPFDRLAHTGNAAHNDRVEPAPDVALPAGHRGNVGLHGGVAVGFRDLRIAAGKEIHRLGVTRTWFRPRAYLPPRGGLDGRLARLACVRLPYSLRLGLAHQGLPFLHWRFFAEAPFRATAAFMSALNAPVSICSPS